MVDRWMKATHCAPCHGGIGLACGAVTYVVIMEAWARVPGNVSRCLPAQGSRFILCRRARNRGSERIGSKNA